MPTIFSTHSCTKMGEEPKKFNEARSCFEKVIENQSDAKNEDTFADRNPFSNSAYWLGQIYLKDNMIEDAKNLYGWVLNTYPNCNEKEKIEKCLESLQE